MDTAVQLREWGFEVRELSPYHFRVNEVFDFYYPRGKWHDLITGERGQKPLDQLAHFVRYRLEESWKGHQQPGANS